MIEKLSLEIQSLSPTSVIELFVIDASHVGAGIFYFHAGTNGVNSNIVWQGQEYIRLPIEASGFEISGQGQIPRPALKVSNAMGSISSLLLAYGDLTKSKVTRKRTLRRYLDAVNFPDGNLASDPTAEFPDDIFYIDRKANENALIVEFELASSMDLAGVSIPRRKIIQNLCTWQYRSAECGYVGASYFKDDDTQTANQTEDCCGKRLSSCKKRFGINSELPFGGFPGAGLMS